MSGFVSKCGKFKIWYGRWGRGGGVNCGIILIRSVVGAPLRAPAIPLAGVVKNAKRSKKSGI